MGTYLPAWRQAFACFSVESGQILQTQRIVRGPVRTGGRIGCKSAPMPSVGTDPQNGISVCKEVRKIVTEYTECILSIPSTLNSIRKTKFYSKIVPCSSPGNLSQFQCTAFIENKARFNVLSSWPLLRTLTPWPLRVFRGRHSWQQKCRPLHPVPSSPSRKSSKDSTSFSRVQQLNRCDEGDLCSGKRGRWNRPLIAVFSHLQSVPRCVSPRYGSRAAGLQPWMTASLPTKCGKLTHWSMINMQYPLESIPTFQCHGPTL